MQLSTTTMHFSDFFQCSRNPLQVTLNVIHSTKSQYITSSVRILKYRFLQLESIAEAGISINVRYVSKN